MRLSTDVEGLISGFHQVLDGYLASIDSHALLPAVKKFPEASLIPYNLACYACQLGDPAEARQWLRKAIARGERDEIKRLALNDPDLAVLREEIAQL